MSLINNTPLEMEPKTAPELPVEEIKTKPTPPEGGWNGSHTDAEINGIDPGTPIEGK